MIICGENQSKKEQTKRNKREQTWKNKAKQCMFYDENMRVCIGLIFLNNY